MAQVMKSRTLTVSIEASAREVYAFASNPANLPLWAPGFCRAIEFVKGEWVVQTPDGHASIRFVTANEYGVLDHYVRLASGAEIYSPMRVIANGAGSEVMFTLFQTPGMPDESYAEDARLVEGDLRRLKSVVEGN